MKGAVSSQKSFGRRENVKPQHTPKHIRDLFLNVWADEGYELYWKEKVRM